MISLRTYRTLTAAFGALLFLLSAFTQPAEAKQRRLIDLSGRWKFELGDDMKRAEPGFNDSKWEFIRVPGRWEDQGYPGYDGYAWYRRDFTVDRDVANQILYLHLGAIDDADEVYVNGHFVGFYGSFPPNFNTAYGVHRSYRLPARYLNPGEDNVIAVRVYDDQLEGGMVRGDIGLYVEEDVLWAEYSLEGTWKFAAGDDMAWKEPGFNDRGWKNVRVPAHWETQGFKDYDGFGWYRHRFTVPASLSSERLILLLGKIDDYDEVYLNGERVGRTGNMPDASGRGFSINGSPYGQLRAYTLPPDVVRTNGENVLAVRVYDGFLHGGIFDGPVGFIQRSHYLQWRNSQKDKRGVVDRFLDFFMK